MEIIVRLVMDDLVGKGAAAKHNNLGAIPRMHRVEPTSLQGAFWPLLLCSGSIHTINKCVTKQNTTHCPIQCGLISPKQNTYWLFLTCVFLLFTKPCFIQVFLTFNLTYFDGLRISAYVFLLVPSVLGKTHTDVSHSHKCFLMWVRS